MFISGLPASCRCGWPYFPGGAPWDKLVDRLVDDRDLPLTLTGAGSEIRTEIRTDGMVLDVILRTEQRGSDILTLFPGDMQSGHVVYWSDRQRPEMPVQAKPDSSPSGLNILGLKTCQVGK